MRRVDGTETERGAVPSAPSGSKQEAIIPRQKTRPARSKCSGYEQHRPVCLRPQPEEPILDGRFLGLLFDSLATVQATLVSASKDVPYTALRPTVAIGEQEKAELIRAVQAVIVKHQAFFAHHKDALEFVTAVTAVNAAQMDHLLLALDHSVGSPSPTDPGPLGGHICSAREAVGIALIVLAPLGLFAVVLIVKHLIGRN